MNERSACNLIEARRHARVVRCGARSVNVGVGSTALIHEDRTNAPVASAMRCGWRQRRSYFFFLIGFIGLSDADHGSGLEDGAAGLQADHTIQRLISSLGDVDQAHSAFTEHLRRELRQNIEEHESECAESCRHFFCGELPPAEKPSLRSYAAGPASNDYPQELAADGASVYVTEAPLFSAEECERVVTMAEGEGGGLPSTRSGKYQIGKAWVKDMPGVLAWFNGALERTLFPTLASLFPRLVGDGTQLRAHTVAILKYNTTHTQTDVHVDDALLAFTIALSPSQSYVGGGTYFEHIGKTLPMERGHVTFRPGSVRHAGARVQAGLRYVLGGFIALADKVEHVRRLNERGNRLLLDPNADAERLMHAERLFAYAAAVNRECSLCDSNRADALLRLDRPVEAEAALRSQIARFPRDGDAHFSLGVALRAQGKHAEALAAFESALAVSPDDRECILTKAAVHGALGEYAAEQHAYKSALALDPNDVKTWLNLGISYSSSDEMEKAEQAFRRAREIAPRDVRVPLNLGRLLAKLSRPAEAIDEFYSAAVLDPDVFDQVKLGVGTARAQQGRLAEATQSFEAAHRMDSKNQKLADSLEEMAAGARALEAVQASLSNAVDDLCGTRCQDVVDASSVAACAIRWADGCGDVTPPDGFTSESTVAELCPHACAFYLMKSGTV